MDFEKQALEILQTFASDDPYQLGYSGGKDSDVIYKKKKKSGVPFIAVHNHTTVDAPETVRYIREKFRKEILMGIDCRVEYPKKTMWQMIVDHKTPPTRMIRYCCEELKENSGKGKKVITGVRKDESRNRSENQGIVTFIDRSKKIKELVDGERKKKDIITGQITITGEIITDANINFHKTNKGG